MEYQVLKQKKGGYLNSMMWLSTHTDGRVSLSVRLCEELGISDGDRVVFARNDDGWLIGKGNDIVKGTVVRVQKSNYRRTYNMTIVEELRKCYGKECGMYLVSKHGTEAGGINWHKIIG